MWKTKQNKSHNEVENIDKIHFFFSVASGNNINEIKLWKSTNRSLLIIGVTMEKHFNLLQSIPGLKWIQVETINEDQCRHQFPHKQLYLYIYIYEVLIAYE